MENKTFFLEEKYNIEREDEVEIKNKKNIIFIHICFSFISSSYFFFKNFVLIYNHIINPIIIICPFKRTYIPLTYILLLLLLLYFFINI